MIRATAMVPKLEPGLQQQAAYTAAASTDGSDFQAATASITSLAITPRHSPGLQPQSLVEYKFDRADDIEMSWAIRLLRFSQDAWARRPLTVVVTTSSLFLHARNFASAALNAPARIPYRLGFITTILFWNRKPSCYGDN